MFSQQGYFSILSPCSCENKGRNNRSLNSPSRRAEPVKAMSDASTASVKSAVEFLRPHLRELAPYTPIVPFEILSEKLGRKPEEIIKLDANENPYGPPPEVLEALGNMSFPHIYPDPESRKLREKLAEWAGVPMEHLLVGCGADELIDLLMRCILEPGDAIVDCPPTFTMYAFDADVNAAQVVTVPRLPGFNIDVPGIRQAVEQHSPKAVFLTSPNNPDGSMISDDDLLEILSLPVLVILDEAYIEFAEVPSKAAWVQKYPNLVVLRTFSKCAALAGMRVGYGAFPLDLVEFLWRAKQPYNVSVAAEVAACAALENKEYIQNVRNLLVEERERLFQGLTSISFLEPYPSNSNFILCKPTKIALYVYQTAPGVNAGELRDSLAQQYGIMIRHYNKKELKGYVRVSVGKPEQTDFVIGALKELEATVSTNGSS